MPNQTRAERIEWALKRSRHVLRHMAEENERRWWQFWVARWPVAEEPLRHDAKTILRAIDEALSLPAEIPEQGEEK